MSPRHLLSILFVVAVPLAGMIWSIDASRLPPADLTFNNSTEIKTVDPALVNGQPEGRIVNALFEGLVRLSPQERLPVTGGPKEWPGVAESWEVSADGRTYTFHLRKDAKWSNGDPVTAEDYRYSMRRFLSPLTAAEYAKQGWYLVNGKKFTSAGAYLEPGDQVEVELNLKPGEHETQTGELVKGTLIRKVPEKMPKDQKERDRIQQRFYVDVEGAERCYVVGDPALGETIPDGGLACRMVMLDFDKVGIRVVDPHTLVTELENPTPFWLQLLGFYPLFPVHRGCLEEYGAPDWTRPENIVTNGPYRIGFRRPRDRVRLVKNENYWNRDNVRLETVDALAVEKTTTSLNMYILGDVDWIQEPPPNLLRELMESNPPRDDFNPAPQFGTYYYKLNVDRGALGDNRVRRALSLALDREDIIRTAVRGPQQPALSLVPPGVPGYIQGTCAPRNPQLARQLIAEAGYPNGNGFPSIEILYNTHEAHRAVAELVRKQWQQTLGITVKLRNEAWPAYQDRLRMTRYDVGRQAWIGDYIDPNTFLDLYVSDNENNQTNWSNEEYDRLIADAERETDAQARLDILHDAEVLLMAEGPIIPIYFYYSRNMVRPHVRGFYNNALDFHPLHSMWIDRSGTTINEFMRSAKK